MDNRLVIPEAKPIFHAQYLAPSWRVDETWDEKHKENNLGYWLFTDGVHFDLCKCYRKVIKLGFVAVGVHEVY